MRDFINENRHFAKHKVIFQWHHPGALILCVIVFYTIKYQSIMP